MGLKTGMGQKNVLVLMPVTEPQKKELETAAPDYRFHYYDSIQEVTASDSKEAHIILGNPPEELLQQFERLEWIQLNSAGYDQYAVPGILPSGVTICNASGAYGLAISEHMVGALLMQMKKLDCYFQNQQQEIWEDAGNVGSIYGARVLVVGLGDIGSEFAKRIKAFGAEVVGLKRSLGDKPDYIDALHTMAELPELLPEADVVALSIPATPETTHLFDRDMLARMKKGAILMNVGRGALIDGDALYEALESGHLGAALLDVTEPEPLPAGHKLWKAKNIRITPHISGGYHHPETFRRILNITLGNLKQDAEGKPLTHVVLESR